MTSESSRKLEPVVGYVFSLVHRVHRVHRLATTATPRSSAPYHKVRFLWVLACNVHTFPKPWGTLVTCFCGAANPGCSPFSRLFRQYTHLFPPRQTFPTGIVCRSIEIGMSRSASFQRVRKSWWAVFALVLSPDKASDLPSCKCLAAYTQSVSPAAQGAVSPMVLPEKARKQLQQRPRFGRIGRR